MLAKVLGRGTELPRTTHADGAETSWTLYFHPEVVRPGYQRFPQSSSSLFLEVLTSGDRSKNPNGSGGFPFDKASAAVGKQIVDSKTTVSATRFCRCCGRSDRVGLCRIDIGTRTPPCSTPAVIVTGLVPVLDPIVDTAEAARGAATKSGGWPCPSTLSGSAKLDVGTSNRTSASTGQAALEADDLQRRTGRHRSDGVVCRAQHTHLARVTDGAGAWSNPRFG